MTHRAFPHAPGWGAALARHLALLLMLSLAAMAAQAFSLDDVEARARALAAQPYQPPAAVAGPLTGLSYDEYRSIRFKPDHALWRDANLPFQLQFFHAGRGFRSALELYEVDAGQAHPLAIPRSDFDYGQAAHAVPASGPADIAGFRVHYALNRPDIKDEVIVFLGASYFRAVGAGTSYGLSARALAVDTVGGSGEEFPAFTAFWVERPAPDATTLTIYGLLDGPHVTGAYRFDLRPGQPTVVDVQSRVFLRAPVATLGIAPLTSMFLAGENQPDPGDFRPEVHDSDGLQVLAADGEWLWRPLVNPSRPFVTSFTLANPRGFGLMQRDRSFASYEDLEAHYEHRPSVWITPQGDWGAGRVELFQFHTPDETNDNVVAYWVPAQLPPPGEPLALAYRMAWGGDELPHPPSAWVVQSRRGHGYHEGPVPADKVEFNIDFAGPGLANLPPDAKVEAVVTAGDNAQVLQVNAYPHPLLHGWRMTVDLKRLDAAKPVELRAFLRNGTHTLSETWSYSLPPEQ
jgi:glucans biosynthesis protein